MLRFVNGHCCPLPSTYYGSVFLSLLQLTLWELHVRRSAIVPEFQEHTRNKTFTVANSFSKTRTDMGPNSASKEGGEGPHLCFKQPNIADISVQW